MNTYEYCYKEFIQELNVYLKSVGFIINEEKDDCCWVKFFGANLAVEISLYNHNKIFQLEYGEWDFRFDEMESCIFSRELKNCTVADFVKIFEEITAHYKTYLEDQLSKVDGIFLAKQ